jgi:hypothetical protein
MSQVQFKVSIIEADGEPTFYSCTELDFANERFNQAVSRNCNYAQITMVQGNELTIIARQLAEPSLLGTIAAEKPHNRIPLMGGPPRLHLDRRRGKA